MVGAGAHDGQAGGVVHPMAEAQGLEGGQALVVVHGQHTIEMAVGAAAEEAVGGVGPHGRDALGHQLARGGQDAFAVLGAQRATVARVGVQAQQGQAGVGDAEVAQQALVEEPGLGHDAVRGDGRGHVLQRDVAGDGAHAQAVGHQHHQHLVHARHMGQVFGVPRVREPGGLHAVLVDRGGHQHVHLAAGEVLRGGLQAADGVGGQRATGPAELQGQLVVPEVHQVQLAGQDLGRIVHPVELHLLKAELLAVQAHGLGRGVQHGRQFLQHAGVLEGLQHHLDADALQVATTDAHADGAAFAAHALARRWRKSTSRRTPVPVPPLGR